MPVVDVIKNLDAASLTLVADFAAPVERVWQIYADPRQLEQIWGPPDYPATFVHHALVPGGRVTYYMTGPQGDRVFGYWQVAEVVAPDHFTFLDGFADAEFEPNTDLPVSHNSYRFEEHEGGTRATYVSTFANADDLQVVLDMGVVEGATAATNQIDRLLAVA